jgi:hypothetical protein
LFASLSLKICSELPADPNQVRSLIELDAAKCAVEKFNNYVNAERIKILEAKECIGEASRLNKRAWRNLQRWSRNCEQTMRSLL